MTNPYGPPVQRTSGARVGDDTSKPTQADSMPQGRGRGRQAAAFKPEQAGSGWIAPASSNDGADHLPSPGVRRTEMVG